MLQLAVSKGRQKSGSLFASANLSSLSVPNPEAQGK